MKLFSKIIVLISILCIIMEVNIAYAQSLPPIIRDTEIETVLKKWSEPLLKAANMPADSINIILVQSPEVNAFVAGGANIFIYTGLIEKTETPEELIGVMAHELGHIAGGHLIKGRIAMERASYESMLGTVLGLGAAILGGGGEAGTAIIRGSQGAATSRFLSHTRTHESSADQAALHYMETAGLNPTGLSTFMEKVGQSELLINTSRSEYMRTHPLSRNRIDAMKRNIANSKNLNTRTPNIWIEAHSRIKAKLMSFISPGRVAWTYDETNTDPAARYARAIAAYKYNDTALALSLMDGLITEEPGNAYFHELKGQMLRDFGRIDDAIPAYKKSVSLRPESGLIRIDYGQVLLADKQHEKAIIELKRALNSEPRSPRAHRFLATAYGQIDKDGLAQLHLAEEALLQRRLTLAKQQASLSIITLEKTPSQNKQALVRARDILKDINNLQINGT